MSDPSDTPTGTAPRPATPTSGGPGARPGSGGRAGSRTLGRLAAEGPARFTVGEVIADRYRIVGLLGRGGMGEVYRADDLRLEQPVALKFLPESVENDAERLARFYNEARLARQVTHPAVCRVHDIGEVDGHPFLSMEFVDGEDVGALLKRIGRLSRDKAAEVGRQLCAGLAAAHAKGVLHRDLKPGNVMIDGQGQVRITDFGLAGLAESIAGDDVRSGTPAYMSPEQLEGRDVTARSDLYSLGLVLYELVTGRRAFDGRTLAEVMRQRAEAPPRPTRLVPDLEPRVEAVILRSLERDPARRPASALAVAAALGADALASALAEGTTPSPEMVAAAGEAEGRLSPAVAAGALAAVVLALSGVVWLYPPLLFTGRVPFDRPPAVLQDRARELLHRLGYGAPADFAEGWGLDQEYMPYVEKRDSSPHRWDRLATGHPPVLLYWYRQSPRPLLARGRGMRVDWADPGWTVSDMVQVLLDTEGRLLSLYAVPRQVDGEGTASAADFEPLFEAAGLDRTRFHDVPSRWSPPVASDVRRAWEGSFAADPDLVFRVEAAAYRGRPVAFYQVMPWTRPERDQGAAFSRTRSIGVGAGLALLFLLLTVGAVIARRHARAGRSDRAGANRLAIVAFSLGFTSYCLAAHHLPSQTDEFEILTRAAGSALLVTAIVWILYLALEPIVRRLWPHALISWTRLLSRGPFDPLVGRDVLLGTAAGALVALFLVFAARLPAWVGHPATEPAMPESGLYALLGLRYGLSSVIIQPLASINVAVGSLLLLALLRLLLRREWLAATVFVVVIGTLESLQWDLPWGLALPVAYLIIGLFVVVGLRLGLLAFVVTAFTTDLVIGLTTTSDLASWSAGPTRLVAATVLGLAIGGFALARRPSGRGLAA